ncbi:MAG TPA: SRPBCC family protein [Acidimicrobiia bacterium]|nr:SRPBCC family protein [Acidimicrobiia bacterium]
MTSLWSEDDAFAYMADARHFAEWDPGTKRVEQVRGVGAGPEAAFDVTAELGRRSIVLHYEVTAFEPPRRVVLEASNALMRLHDEIVIDRVATDTLITYDARVTLRGPLKVFDGLLARRFRTVGERAAAGLRERVLRPA